MVAVICSHKFFISPQENDASFHCQGHVTNLSHSVEPKCHKGHANNARDTILRIALIFNHAPLHTKGELANQSQTVCTTEAIPEL